MMGYKIKNLILLLLFTCISCKRHIDHAEIDNTIANDTSSIVVKQKEKSVITPKNKEFSTELAVNSIVLGDSKSLLNLIKEPVFIESEDDNFPKLIAFNKSKDQILTMYSYPGSTKNSIDYFVIEKANETDKEKGITLLNKNFVTNNNVSLNLSEEELIQKYSSNNMKLKRTVQDDNLILTYSIEDLENPLLKKNNMPAYIAKYRISKGKIVKIEFGFIYP